MQRVYANPNDVYPIKLPDGSDHKGTVFLKPAIDHPRLEVGAYTYASAHHPPEDWAFHLAPYLYPFSPERLVIGTFCQIASAVQFITASANHRYDGISSFPFAIFGGGAMEDRPSMPEPGKTTRVGHDVWFGTGSTVLPGAQIGNGVIVGAGAVVSGNIPSYAIVVGNPGKVVRMRFEDEIIARLETVAWWAWPIETILDAEAEICGGDVDALEKWMPNMN
jgi:virginiamycin A acetyltransferase